MQRSRNTELPVVEAAKAWGDQLTRAHAARVGEIVLRSDVTPQRGEIQVPVVIDGEQASDSHIGW